MLPSGTSSGGSSNSKPLRQELFASPLISTFYETVLPPLWTAGLRIGGPDAEYDSAMAYLAPDGAGGGSPAPSKGVALDLSCGTGFVATRMAKSNRFDHVFGLDYSPDMLNECIASVIRDEDTYLGSKMKKSGYLSWIRGDAGALPFANKSLDAIHWGAGMHCVPDAEGAMREAHRVLKPGGRLYATTFLKPFPDIVFRFFTTGELEMITRDAGFGGTAVEVEGRGVYGIIRATKLK